MAQDNEIFIEDDSVALEDIEDTESTSEDSSVSSIIPYVMDRYKRSEDFRNQDEERWLRSYRNYRGQYGSDVQFTEAEKSRVFIKVTKTKTLAAYGQIVDVLFANNKFPNFPGFPDGNPSTDVRTARGAAPLIVGFTLRKGRARVQCIK